MKLTFLLRLHFLILKSLRYKYDHLYWIEWARQLLLHFYLLSNVLIKISSSKWSLIGQLQSDSPTTGVSEQVTGVPGNGGHSRSWSRDLYSQRSREGFSLKSKSLIPAIKIRKLTSQTTILSPTTQEQHDLTILSQKLKSYNDLDVEIGSQIDFFCPKSALFCSFSWVFFQSDSSIDLEVSQLVS